MRVQVSDLGSNYEENLQRWARTLGIGEIRRKIFLTVYSTKKRRWTIPEIAAATGLDGKAIATQGRKMCVGGLFEQLDGSKVVYQKIDEVHHAKAAILRHAGNIESRESIPTKRNSRGRGVVVSKTTNNFKNVGVANTGQMLGTITGNSQRNQLNESAKEFLQAVEQFRKDVNASHALSSEQREDAVNAVNDLEEEAKKPEESRSLSRVRNSVSALRMLSSGVQALHNLYDQVHPLIASHFHLPS